MVVALLFAVAVNPRVPVALAGGMEWEETPVSQATPGYHPRLRFNASSTFVFATPDYIAEGHYTQQNDQYFFRPETAFQLNHADVDKLVADLDPQARQRQQDTYARSLTPFDADYNASSGALSVHYPGAGGLRTYALFPYTAGDENLSSAVSDAERGFVGLWSAPEPFPDRLDSKTRYRIGGLEGLQRFSAEGIASDDAQLNFLDLRVDKSFRLHAKQGRWQRKGATITLSLPDGELVLTISADGQKLLAGGKAVYVRG